MSPIISSEERRAGIKGKRIPGKPGRFDPDRPLHMTTRGAAKKHNPNGESPSVDGSYDDSESRRGSLDDARPTTSHSLASQPPAYDTGDLEAMNMDVSPTFVASENVVNARSEYIGVNKPPPIIVEEAPTPSRKRKRSSLTPPVTPNDLFVDTAQQVESVSASEERDSFEAVDLGELEEGDFVELVDPNLLSDREMSESSSESGEHADDDIILAAPSLNITPAVSVPHSPPSSMSASQDGLLVKNVELPLVPVEQSDEGEALDDGDEAEGMDEVEEADEGGRQKRRWGGRRRQCHPERKVELAMQRQLHLKKAYRTIAREMKAIAIDIAKRTLDELNEDPRSHEQAAEYPDIKVGLEDALERRRALVQAQHRLGADQLRQRLEAEQQVIISSRQLDLRNLQDRYLDRLEHQILLVARSAHLAENSAGHETEAEGDIVPRPKRIGYKFKRGDALDPEYDSRSRQLLEEEQATEDLYRRIKMRKLLADLGDERPRLMGGFAVMDSTARDAAKVKREGTALTRTLNEAAREVERRSLLLVPNEAATALQMLGDLALRPSLRADVRRVKEHVIAQTPPRHIPPPIALPPANHHSVPVELSPRTNRLVGDRFDFPMAPPPQTPHDMPSVNDEHRHEHPPVSPYNLPEGLTRLSQPADRPQDRELHPRSRPSPFYQLNSLPDWCEYRRVDSSDGRETTSGASVHGSSSWQESAQSIAGVSDSRTSSVSGRASTELADRAAFPGFRAASATSSRTNVEPWSTERPSGAMDTMHKRAPSPGRQRHYDILRETSRDGNHYKQHTTKHNEAASPRSRKPSMLSVVDAKSSNPPSADDVKPTGGEDADKQRRLSDGRPFWRKTNKEERGGQSRRANKKAQKHGRPQSLGSALPPTLQRHPSAGLAQSPTEHAPALPTSNLPAPPLLPLAPYTLQYVTRPSQPPAHSQPESEHGQAQQHRNSFPPLQPPPPGWTPLTNPSPLFTVPRPAPPPPPPPPGVAPDQYNHPFAHYPPPPPPPHFQPPPPSSFLHQPPSSQYNQQFGGQPIAPATPDSRHHQPGYRPGPSMPAFAQRHIDGPRRRTQSDVNTTRRWQHWEPGQSSSGPQRKR